MKTNSQKPNRKIWMGAMIGIALVALFAQPRTASGQQWTSPDGSGNIWNTNTGNVGIGTSSPGASRLTVSTSGASDNPLTLINTAPTGFSQMVLQGTGRIWGINVGNASNASVPNKFSIFDAGAAAYRFVIDTSGNVGIGTTSPRTTLHITSGASGVLPYNSGSDITVGTLESSANGYLSILTPSANQSGVLFGNVASNVAGGIVYNNTATANGLQFRTNGNNTRMVIDSSGNVGIGTTAPSFKVHTVDGGSTTVGYSAGYFESGTPTAGNLYGIGIDKVGTELLMLGINKNTSTGSIPAGSAYISTYVGTGTLALGRGNTAGLPSTADIFINGSGNIGIGLTAPVYKLDVAGQIRSASGGFVFPNGTVQTVAATMTGITAGAGLTGGGTSGTANLDIGQGTGITVAADSISVNYGSTPGTAVQGNTSITVTAGDGMSGGGSITLGSGGTVILTNTSKGADQVFFKNFSNLSGSQQVSATLNNDTVKFDGTGGTTVAFDSSAKKITIDSSGITSSQWTPAGTNNINYAASGNVGVGNPTPASKLDVTGNGHFTGNLTVDGNIAAKYQDMAEWVPSSEQLSTGTVVVLDSTKSNQVISSTQAYDTRVAGVISEQPGIALGEGGAGKVLVATTGRVLVQVDASKSSIQIGDLLVTSDVPGVAMRSEPVNLGGVQLHRPGTLIGKALEPLEKGSGKILVLLSLQ